MSVADHVKGHFFLFGVEARKLAPSAFWALLGLFLIFECVIGPRAGGLARFGLTPPPELIRIAVMGAVLLLAVRLIVGPLSGIGLKRWRGWTLAEKSYFAQALLLANGVFIYLRRSRLQTFLVDPSLILAAGATFFTHFLWGFYQEIVYRGVLQSALAHRFGAIPGIIAANVAFTFGPLHFYHFSQTANPATMFAAIFAIGLLFGALFQRSGNLFIVGVLHGLGDAYLSGL